MGLFQSYIIDMLKYVTLLLPFYVLIRAIYLKANHKTFERKREIYYLIFFAYIMGVLSQTIIPLHSWGNPDVKFGLVIYISDVRKLNIVPFRTIFQYLFTQNNEVDDWFLLSLLNLLANTILFVPFGFLFPIVYKKVNRYFHVLLFGITFIVLIEIIQFFVGRTSDIDDVILNLVGVSFGFVIHKTYQYIKIRRTC